MVRHKQNWHDGTHSDGGVSKMCLHFGRGPWQEINNLTMKILAIPKMRQMSILLQWKWLPNEDVNVICLRSTFAHLCWIINVLATSKHSLDPLNFLRGKHFKLAKRNIWDLEIEFQHWNSIHQFNAWSHYIHQQISRDTITHYYYINNAFTFKLKMSLII